MSQDNKIRMPSSMGGLVSYFDEYKSKIEIKPGVAIIAIIAIIILAIVMNFYAKSLFGF